MNLSNIILQGALHFPDHEAVVFEDSRFTYRELNAAVDIVATHLRGLGLRPRDRVALYCENRPEWIMLYYGIVRTGAAVVCVSPSYRDTELNYLLTDSEPACVITSEGLVAHIPKEALLHIRDMLVIFMKSANIWMITADGWVVMNRDGKRPLTGFADFMIFLFCLKMNVLIQLLIYGLKQLSAPSTMTDIMAQIITNSFFRKAEKIH